jgi:hypothetical protein
MRRTLGLAVVGLVLVAATAWVGAQSGTSALEGAWAVESISYPKPPAAAPNKPAGLIQFSGRHYSMMFLLNSSRPIFGPDGPEKASADQLRAVWDPLTANAGTFTVSGNTLRTTPSVAKMPDVMAAGAFTERTFTLNGDTLVLTTARSNTGPVANPQTIRLRRVR